MSKILFVTCILFLFQATISAQHKHSDQHADAIELMLNKNQNQLKFIENKGQWPAKEKFRASTPHSRVQLMNNGFMPSIFYVLFLMQNP